MKKILLVLAILLAIPLLSYAKNVIKHSRHSEEENKEYLPSAI